MGIESKFCICEIMEKSGFYSDILIDFEESKYYYPSISSVCNNEDTMHMLVSIDRGNPTSTGNLVYHFQKSKRTDMIHYLRQ